MAAALVDLAAALMPARLRHWGERMRCEVAAIEAPGEALRFAAGCLWGAICEMIRVQSGGGKMAMWWGRRLVGLCAIGATGLGIGYMTIGGAPGVEAPASRIPPAASRAASAQRRRTRNLMVLMRPS